MSVLKIEVGKRRSLNCVFWQKKKKIRKKVKVKKNRVHIFVDTLIWSPSVQKYSPRKIVLAMLMRIDKPERKIERHKQT